MEIISSQTKRRAVRRAVYTPCVAVAQNGYRLIGQRVLDLSPRGMLVTCGVRVGLGEKLMVSFQPPGKGPWMNTEAEVTRLVHGLRFGDRGPCAGLVFRDLSRSEREELLVRLAGIPPTIPSRPLRFHGRSCRPAEPIFPLVVKKGSPFGLWAKPDVFLQPIATAAYEPARGVFSAELN